MSKPKPRASAPPRPSGQATHTPAKFYDGPTVSNTDKSRRKSSPNAPSPQQDAYKPTPIHAVKQSPVPASQLQVVKSKRKPKRSGWTLWGVITVLPLLLFASLFSTVLCPPPSDTPSSFSQMALGTLGLKVQPAESSLHRTLCYPANVYHREVLVPYVYPAIEDVKAMIHQSPVYRDHVEPAYKVAGGHAYKLWNGPIKPVVDRTCRGAKIVHRTYIAPHVPYVQAKFTETTAPLRMRISALYNQHLAPHVNVAKKHACTAYKNGKTTYRTVASHPATAQAGKHAQNAYVYSKQQGARAYQYSKPHAIRAYNEGMRHTHETLLPRTAQGLHYAGHQIDNSWVIVRANWQKFYAEHLAVHLDPYLAKIHAALEPLYVTFDKQIYVPFIQPAVDYIKQKGFWSSVADVGPVIGSAVDQGSQKVFEASKGAAESIKEGVKQAAADTEQKAAEAMAALEEKAAAAKKEAEVKAAEAKKAAEIKAAEAEQDAAEAKKAAEKKAALKKEAEQKAAEAEVAANARAAFKKAEASRAATSDTDDVTRKATVVPTHSGTSMTATVSHSVGCDAKTGAEANMVKEAEATGTTEAEAAGAKDHLSEAQALIAQLKKKVDFQGKALYAKVQTETVKQAERFLELLPEMKKIGDENLDREISRMIGGLDRLYSNSRSLTRDQVDESQRMSDAKVLKVLEQVTNGVKTKKNQIYEKVQPAVTNAQTEIDRVLGDEYAALGKRLSIIEGVSSKDWDAYKALKKDVASWKGKFTEAPEKATTKQLKDVIHKVQVGASETITDFADSYEGWKTRQGILRKQAMDRIDARDALSSETKRATQATIAVPKKKEGKGSILDMEEKKKDTTRSPLLAKVDDEAKSTKDEL